jgi:hypothetical protein
MVMDFCDFGPPAPSPLGDVMPAGTDYDFAPSDEEDAEAEAEEGDVESEPAEYPWFLSLPFLASLVIAPVGGIVYYAGRSA